MNKYDEVVNEKIWNSIKQDGRRTIFSLLHDAVANGLDKKPWMQGDGLGTQVSGRRKLCGDAREEVGAAANFRCPREEEGTSDLVNCLAWGGAVGGFPGNALDLGRVDAQIGQFPACQGAQF